MHTRTHNDVFVVCPLLLFVLTTFLIPSMCVLSLSSSLVFLLFFIICPLFFVLFSFLFFLISLSSFLSSINCLFPCPFSFLSSVPFWLSSSLPVSSNLCDLVDLFSSFSSPLLSPPSLSPFLFLLSLLQYTLMAVYVWIFYRTDGVQHMTYHQY